LKLAIFSDIHGNTVALDAVLKDIKDRGPIDEYWILGDLVALGPDPVGVLERVTELPNVRIIRGNTDRYVFAGDRPPPSMEEAARDATKLTALVECAGTFAWTQGAVTSAGWLEWLAKLPLEVETVLPNGTRVLGVHAAPGRDDGLGIKLGMSEEEIGFVLTGCTADLVAGGHHHRTLDVSVNGLRAINVGSVSNPMSPDLRASYVVIESDSDSHSIEFGHADYDRDAVIAQLDQANHPGRERIINHFRGNRGGFGREWIDEQLRDLRSSQRSH
jgi:predicted phosphodiesterase